jgi:hypothetical protein
MLLLQVVSELLAASPAELVELTPLVQGLLADCQDEKYLNLGSFFGPF